MTHSHDYHFALPPETSLQNGAFALRETVGRGGTSFIYRAFDVRLAREVAIKEFFPWGSIRDESGRGESGRGEREVVANSDIEYSMSRAAFIEEARALARFDHPHIVRVFAVFEENNSAYIVEEFLHGHTLQHQLDQNGALSMDAAMETLRPVCEAVETLHGAGLVHGDIKPINIMRTRNGRIVLLDFGLTASLPESQYATTLLAPQRGVGTSGYAPIEQYSKHGNPSPASDIYALSASLWQLITNQLPPDAPGRASGIALPDIRSLVPQIAENTARALQRGLAMNAQNRPQSVRDWWNEVTDLVETPSEETSSTQTGADISAAPSKPVFLAPQTHIYQQAQGFPWSLVFLSCSLFALLAVMMLWR